MTGIKHPTHPSWFPLGLRKKRLRSLAFASDEPLFVLIWLSLISSLQLVSRISDLGAFWNPLSQEKL